MVHLRTGLKDLLESRSSWIWAFALIAYGMLWASAAKAKPVGISVSLERISGLDQAGAPELALKMLDREQPSFVSMRVVWLQWERERVHIYQSAKQWHALSRRVRHLPHGLPNDFLAWELLQSADAELRLGHNKSGRSLMRQLTSLRDPPPSEENLKQAKKLIIKSYIAAHKFKAAQAALLRFRRAYGGASRELAARLFLHSRQPRVALRALENARSAQASLLRMLAKLRINGVNASKVAEQARELATNPSRPKQIQAAAWKVAADAALLQANPAARVTRLERALALAPHDVADIPLWTVAPDALWKAYLQLGAKLVHQLQLEADDFGGMFLAASNRFDSHPLEARALLAVVAFHAAIARQRAVAQGQFALSLNKQSHGGDVLNELYLHSKRFRTLAAVPAAVRYILVKHALATSDIGLAARLMRGLNKPPANADPLDWRLKRIQVFMRVGRSEAAVAGLARLLSSGAKVSLKQVLPVLFDLQAAGQDRAAIRFFTHFLHAKIKSRQRRHLFYWVGDSYLALGEYLRAARMYMESAMGKNPFAMDQWAQSARYKAAQALARAGLTGDAKRQYQTLLNASDDPSRRAVLRHAIEQLKLTGTHVPSKP